MQPPLAKHKSVRKPLARVVMVCSVLLAGCSFEKPPGPTTQGSTLAALVDMAEKPHARTGSIPAADLDKMSTSGEAYFEDRFIYATLKNHLDYPLGQITLRVVLTKEREEGAVVREDTKYARTLLAAPNSEFKFTVKAKRKPRGDEAWVWALVDGDKGEDPR